MVTHRAIPGVCLRLLSAAGNAMGRILAALLGLLLVGIASAQVHVRGYMKKNGTYVAPYVRSSPNSSRTDNYSTRGNYNPYTGREGKVNPYPFTSYTAPAYRHNTYVSPASAPSYYQPPPALKAQLQKYQQNYGGNRCTSDCSGHEAGYEWAEQHGITDAGQCGGNSQSFIEGCETFADEQGD